jgi:rRNA maturation protein Nop10
MKMRKCPSCFKYGFEEVCDKCRIKTKDAHYKFVKIKSEKEN